MNIYDACVNRARAVCPHREANELRRRFFPRKHCVLWTSLAACQHSYPTHLFEAVDEALPVDPLQAVAADVEVDEPEAGLHVVVVAQLLDAVVPEVEPEQRLGDEGVVEPLQQVVRHVEPLQVVLRVQQPVQLLQPVVVQSEGLQEKE